MRGLSSKKTCSQRKKTLNWIFIKKPLIMISNIITISPEVQSGTPVFAGTRVPIKILFDYLKGGDTIDEFLNDFPSVKKEQVEQLLKLAENIVTLNLASNEKSAA